MLRPSREIGRMPSMPWSLSFVLALSSLPVGGCATASTPRAEAAPSCRSATYPLLAANRSRYRHAISAARHWLDGLELDPFVLRDHGLKGKKKLVELVDAYARLFESAEPADKPELMRRIRQIVAPTYDLRFHDMLAVGDLQFRQDSTSYLRCALLMDRVGLDTTFYREQIRKAQPRLDAHLSERGPAQQQAFHWYYAHFGLKEPFALGGALRTGLIARRADPVRFSKDDTYQLTHEVFIPYEYGDRLDVDPFDAPSKAYLERAFDLLVARYLQQGKPDAVAELVSCMRQLRLVEELNFRRGLVYLLDSQNADGSWGDRAHALRVFGDFADAAILLHTTMVAIDALALAFYEPWNQNLYPRCDAR